ncbi:MAG: DNA topoisomerase IB [Marmoricola sp.]
MRLRRTTPQQPGWRRVRRGRGFSYLDAAGQPLAAADVERVKALVIPPAWVDVWICPFPNGHLQCVGQDEAGRRQYLYHPAWREQQDAKKFERVMELARRLPGARRQLQAALARTGPPDRETALAAAVRLVDLGCFRLGDDAYTETYGSHGLTTLQCRHVQTTGGGLVFDFVGKSGVEHLIEIDDRALVRTVTAMRARRRGDARLLAYRGPSRWEEIASDDVNQAIRDFVGLDVTAKDFRTWHGTVRVAATLASQERGASATERARQVRKAVADAADLLGNTPTVARGSYVNPRVIDLFEDGVTISSTVARLSKDPTKAQDQLDRAVVKLLR